MSAPTRIGGSMISLGIDPSLTGFGWAIHDNSATGLARIIDSGHMGTPTDMVPVMRFVVFRDLVDRVMKMHNPDCVGMESPAYTGAFQVVHHGLMLYAMEAVFYNRRDLVLFDPSTLKSLLRGMTGCTGAINKADVQRWVSLDTMDASVINHNQADAYALGFNAARFFSLLGGHLAPESLNEYEAKIFLERTKTVKTLKGPIQKNMAHAFRENQRYFRFSQIATGDVKLPAKQQIDPSLVSFLDERSLVRKKEKSQ